MASFSQAIKCQNYLRIHVSDLTPKMPNSMSDKRTKHQIFAEKQIFLKILRQK